MKDPAQSIKVRMPPKVKAWVAEQAAQNCRSMNGQIVYCLEAAMAAEATSRPLGGAPAAGQASQA